MLTPDRFTIVHTVLPNERAPRSEPGEFWSVILLTPTGEHGSVVGQSKAREGDAVRLLRATLKLIKEGLPVTNNARISFQQEAEGLFLMPRARTLEIAERMIKMPASLARVGFKKVVHEVKPDPELGREFHYYTYAFGK